MPGEKTVDISIGARLDRLDGALREAFAKFEKFDKAVQARQQREPEAVTQGTFKLSESLGNLAKGVVTLEALRGGLQSIATLAENADRGVMGIVEALEKLPFGIGGAIEGFKRILAVVTGIGSEIDKLDKFAKAQDQANAAAKERGKAFDDTNSSLSQIARGKDAVLENRIEQVNRITNAGIDNAGKALAVQIQAGSTPVTENDSRVKAQMKWLEQNQTAYFMETGRTLGETRDTLIKQLQEEDDRRNAQTLSAGHAARVKDTRKLQSEAIAQVYEEVFNDFADKTANALVENFKNKEEQAKKALESKTKEQEKTKQARETEWNMRQSATRQAEANLKQMGSEIESQRLNPTEVSAQYSGIKEDKTSRIQEQQLKVQEESARILQDMLKEAQKKQDFINAGFDG